jgi:hypothetical protein
MQATLSAAKLDRVAATEPWTSMARQASSTTTTDGSRLVLLGADEIAVDRLFAQCLAGFEAMQPMDKDKAITITPNEDGCLLSEF